MNGEKDRYESNTAGQADAPADQAQAGQTPQNDEAERLRREAEEARRREEELRELVRLSLQQQQSYSSTAPQSDPYASTPDVEVPDDLDLDDPRAIAKFVREQARREAEAMARQLVETYSSDRQKQMAAIAAAQFQSFKERLEAAGHGKLAYEVEKFIRENHVPPDQLVTPDAYEGIASYILGQESFRQVISSRPPNLSANGRFPAPEPGSSVSDSVVEEFRRMVGTTDDLDLEELARIAEKGEMTSEDYRRLVKEAK